mgnify:CR=1 FL=1
MGGTPVDQSVRVLIADDHPLVRGALREAINGAVPKADIIECEDLDKASQALSDNHEVDLILLDLMMPTMDGWQVLQSLKADVELTHIPVVITSIVVEENRGSIIGAVDLLQKPILREDLQRVIGKQLRPRVLVVEDNHSDQCIFANGLAAEGIEFRVANSGRDALLVLDQFNPDVVLLDILLPEMDGMEFLHHLRRNPRLEHLPVFIVTAKELAPAELVALQRQANFVLRKSGDLATDFKGFVESSVFQAVIKPSAPADASTSTAA